MNNDLNPALTMSEGGAALNPAPRHCVTVNDLCAKYENLEGMKLWGLARINEFLDALSQSPISPIQVPADVRSSSWLFMKLEWLNKKCPTKIPVDALEGYFLDCQS